MTTVALTEAFDLACEIELLPMREAEQCEVRLVIDDTAALALGVEPTIVADWRRRLAREPTITNERTPTLEEWGKDVDKAA